MECEIDSSELLEQKGYCLHWQGEGVCNTGDTFLTELSDVKGDVVDMEAYAQALVCRAKNTPFIAVKYVTDIIGQNSVKHWEDKLADARKGLGEFLEALGGVV
jgi:adenosylhomocysteine nucleosidase